MKLLPHYFKWIGISSIILGFLIGIDDLRLGFMGSSAVAPESFQRLLPEFFSRISDFPLLLGLLMYMLSKNKTEDEFAQKLRFETAFIVLIITIVVLIISSMINPAFTLKPSIFIVLQMIAYLVIRSVKRGLILAE